LYKIPAKTLFIGKNIIFVPECNSTNTLAQQISQQSSISDGTVVITDNQTAGRGQRGNSWEVEPGTNFTFSLILKTGFLLAQDQFALNLAISVGILDYLEVHLKSSVRIKWPNDILVENRKVCGILIENSIKGSLLIHSVVGIGINVNQIHFVYDRSTSLKKETGKTFSLHNELENLLWCIEKSYMLLRQQNFTPLLEKYYQNLYGFGEERKFKSSGAEWTGTITGVDNAGRLKVQAADGEKVFGFKEIEFVY
jgi:BirA family biotin operon repressor/biotin-[acetyl-CoA-carboxylase] ligase